jgi:hypothetical protein
MSEEGGFITMPLCWLNADRKWKGTLDAALEYGFYHFLLQSLGGEAAIKADRQKAEEAARRAIGFRGGNLSNWKKSHDEVAVFERSFTAQHGPTFHPRIDSRLGFEARDGEGISEHEMRVHIALLSALGSKGFMRLGWKPIQWRAAGFLRRPPEGTSGLLSRGQIDRAVRSLVARGLWVCYSYPPNKHAGERYWTNRRSITLENLVAMVHKAKAKGSDYAEQQQRAAEIAAKLRTDARY